ncbi:MAG: branched chain amino acid aminotransferase [Deltaproteobacteria bacterium CG_4_10_14_3_um_filter_60_8]|nr:MAG: branched chain amino acid aminotransferase [Deltaproteobacteria bacterium CG23_combo_of_CG06-09_8_20_14_all_60_8]PIY21106.1 MAG: branched chain amino acid aminotransferase [Deltaproteobacteria bacterium CG_4_10_14_3_um_filter_60_8]
MRIQIERVAPGNLKPKPDESALGFGRHRTDHMFVMTYDEGQGWHDAAVMPYQDFALDPAAMVLHYGQAIFEGLKAYRGKDDAIFLFRPLDNLRRMNLSAARMCMPQIQVEEVFEGLKTLVDIEQDWVPRAQGATLYIRPTMVATEAGLGVRPAKRYLFFIILSPVGAYYPEGFNPVSIYVTDTYVRAVPGGVGNAKTAGNYAASIMAAVEAKKQGYTQVLWLDAVHRKYVEEVGTMNIFFVIDNEVITPPLSGSILPGITRDSVLKMVREWGKPVAERSITIDEVLAASQTGRLQEVFGTGTAAVISPVGSLYYQGQNCEVNHGHTGPLSQRLFDELQAIQYGRQPDPYHWMVRL